MARLQATLNFVQVMDDCDKLSFNFFFHYVYYIFYEAALLVYKYYMLTENLRDNRFFLE